MASPEEQLKTMLANLPEKTGKTLAEWKAVLAASGAKKHGQMVKAIVLHLQMQPRDGLTSSGIWDEINTVLLRSYRKTIRI